MFNSLGRSSNFAQAGKSAADETVKAFAASRRNSTNFGELTQKAANLKSQEKIAAMKAASQVTRAGINAATSVEKTKINIEGKQAQQKGKRKAGALAAAGQLFGNAGQFLGEKRTKRTVGSEDGFYDTQIDKAKTKGADFRTQAENVDMTGGFTPMETPTLTIPGLGGSDTKPTSTATPAAIPGKSKPPAPQKGGDTAMSLMNDLTSQGLSPASAAGIVGNAQYESANFTAHEEYAPNAYGTKGAGMFQWTNAGGSNRRDQFESYAKNNNLDPTSYQANAGYMVHEMKGNSGNHWTGGMNLDSYGQINDLSTAVTSFQNNYLRPAKATANTSQRLSNAQAVLDRFNKLNS